MKNYILMPALSIVLLSSCTTFNKRMLKNDLSVIKKENASDIDGQYEFKGYEHISPTGKKN